MSKKPDTYHRPETLTEALHLLARPNTAPLAGGTKLLAGKNDAPDVVVDLQALGLDEIKWESRILHVGATAKLVDLAAALVDTLAESERAESAAALLQKAIRQAGPNTYRNAATLGGVIASRLPDSELLAVLLVLDAELTLQVPDAVTMSLVDYLGATERPFNLITNITIPWVEGQGSSHRVARTPADYPIVSVTLWQPDGDAPRLAATGIGERPFRLTEAEMILADGLTETAVESAAAAAQSACHHPGDFRGDAVYRAEMAAVLTRRVGE